MYYAKMPWLAVPLQSQDIVRALSSKHGIMGIPALLIFSPDGEILTKSGVAAVCSDPDGEQFPWKGHTNGLTGWIGPLIQLALIAFMIYLAVRQFIPK
jgi:hypothetical protein